jgi:hypothetical protein
MADQALEAEVERQWNKLAMNGLSWVPREAIRQRLLEMQSPPPGPGRRTAKPEVQTVSSSPEK